MILALLRSISYIHIVVHDRHIHRPCRPETLRKGPGHLPLPRLSGMLVGRNPLLGLKDKSWIPEQVRDDKLRHLISQLG